MSVQQVIIEKLQVIAPSHLEVINESHGHSVPANSETHFKVIMAADAFAGKRAVARHQVVYGLLQDELAGGVHALALHLYTPQEWADKGVAPASPVCASKQ